MTPGEDYDSFQTPNNKNVITLQTESGTKMKVFNLNKATPSSSLATSDKKKEEQGAKPMTQAQRVVVNMR